MQSGFKRFGERDTGSFREEYARTRLQLTFIYSVISIALLVVSGSITRTVFSERLDQRFAIIVDRKDRVHSVILPIDADDVRSDLSNTLLLVNGVLVVLSVLASYWLASRTLRPIQDAYEHQRQFLSDASHELRTPLAILQANLENERDSGSADLQVSAKSHLEEVRRMSALVSDVLSLSKLEHAGSEATRTPIIVNDVLQNVVNRLSPIAANHHVALVLEDAAETFTVFAAEEPLIRVLTNVIENAIVYNKTDGSVTVSMEREDDAVRIDVADTGVGIGEKDVQKIFDRFYRADKSRSRRTGGSGLGLSIARSIVEAFGGTISMKSTVDIGTTVSITLPVHNAS